MIFQKFSNPSQLLSPPTITVGRAYYIIILKKNISNAE